MTCSFQFSKRLCKLTWKISERNLTLAVIYTPEYGSFHTGRADPSIKKISETESTIYKKGCVHIPLWCEGNIQLTVDSVTEVPPGVTCVYMCGANLFCIMESDVSIHFWTEKHRIPPWQLSVFSQEDISAAWTRHGALKGTSVSIWADEDAPWWHPSVMHHLSFPTISWV